MSLQVLMCPENVHSLDMSLETSDTTNDTFAFVRS